MNIFSFCPTHDSSVCFLENGKVSFFCKEERLSRKKRDNSPFKSLDLFFKNNKQNIDHIIFSSPSFNLDTSAVNFYQQFISKKINFNCAFEEFSHHLCHAMLAFVNSKFEESIVIVIDRDGSSFILNNELAARESESVYLFNKKHGYKDLHKSFYKNPSSILQREYVINAIKLIYPNAKVTLNNDFSIVKVYEAATTLLALNPLENGKTMGLSSYGDGDIIDPLFVDNIPIAHKFSHISVDDFLISCFFNEEHKINGNITEQNYKYYANRAKQVQIETQKQALNLIKNYVEKTGIKNVCVVGGYALNVVANNFYIKNLPDVKFYFEPTADDTGVSIGGAMVKYFNETQRFAEPLENNFFHYYDNTEKLNIGEKSSIDEVVDMLVNGKSVAIFDGNPESGPRALGHRSILFDARNPNAKEIVNRIKKREWYRPFAGVILKSEFVKYFRNLGLSESQYMTINFDANEETKELVPGIIHVDGTCRVQTTNEGFLFNLLNAFNKKTSCPMLLNTSFNLAGEPLVQTKADAINTFNNSELDAVYFVEDKKIIKK